MQTICHGPWRSGHLPGELIRAVLPKVDDLATMIEHERVTYEEWLGSPQVVSALLRRYFEIETESKAFGKLSFVGRRRRGD